MARSVVFEASCVGCRGITKVHWCTQLNFKSCIKRNKSLGRWRRSLIGYEPISGQIANAFDKPVWQACDRIRTANDGAESFVMVNVEQFQITELCFQGVLENLAHFEFFIRWFVGNWDDAIGQIDWSDARCSRNDEVIQSWKNE